MICAVSPFRNILGLLSYMSINSQLHEVHASPIFSFYNNMASAQSLCKKIKYSQLISMHAQIIVKRKCF